MLAVFYDFGFFLFLPPEKKGGLCTFLKKEVFGENIHLLCI